MQLREMLQDDDAVSPVIGVILMVAITVILAAVIASFVLGLGPGEAAPTASFDFEANDGNLTITHANGDTLDPENIHIRGEGIALGTNNDNDTWNAVANATGNDAPTHAEVDQIGGGSSATVEIANTDDYSVRVVWETADSSQTLDEHEA